MAQEESRKCQLHGKRLPMDDNAEMTQMLKLSVKDFKVVIKMLKEVRVNTPEINKIVESFSKEAEDTKQNQMKILKLKNIRTKKKNKKTKNHSHPIGSIAD